MCKKTMPDPVCVYAAEITLQVCITLCERRLENSLLKSIQLKILLYSMVALIGTTVAGPAQAAGQWYLGGSITQSSVDEPGIDADDTSGKLFGGYRFNKHFSIEGTYYDLGELTQGANQLALDGFGIAINGYLPLADRLSLFGKVGLHAWDADVRGPIASRLSDSSDTDTFYGVGVEYRLSDRLDVRAEFERYNVDDFDVDAISAGVSFRF